MFARLTILAPLLLISGTAAPAQPAPLGPDAKAWAERCGEWDDWDKAGPPFRIFGNTYYVGTCGIGAILITGDEGHVVIDGGTEKGAGLIAANIEALGFKLSDVKILLHSHEHHDHAGGLAGLQRLTGARLLASAAAAPVLASGKAGKDDPQFDEHATFPAARVDGRVADGKPVRLGTLSLTPVATPGHTPGALSWSWRACEGGDCRDMVYADSLSPVSSDGYHFIDHPAYVEAYRASIARVAALPCQILLTPHPSASRLRERLLEGDLAGPPSCADYAADIEVRLDERLFKEAGPE